LSDFQKALDYVLAQEGGYSSDPLDKGGSTNMGITQHTLDDFRLLGIGSAFPLDVKYLTKDQAGMIYQVKYWIWGPIKDDRTAAKLMDIGVNIGPTKAVKLAQVSANAVLPSLDLVVDGKFGPATIAGINSVPPSMFLEDLVGELKAYYMSLNQPHFLKGWLARAERLPE
jgi:lysozyme family protein